MASLVTQQTLALVTAIEAVEAGRRSAEEIGAPMTIVIVDNAGTPKALIRMDGSPVLSVTTAMNKAYTAAVVGVSTCELGDLGQSNPRVLAALPHLPRVSMIGGGTTLKVGNDVVGAVGVSGGSEDQDVSVAVAVAAFVAS